MIMKNFIAYSESSKKILNIAQMSTALPVNVIITGESGVGKKLLASHALPDATVFRGDLLEKALIDKTVAIGEYKEIIIADIENVLNKKEFMENLEGIKVVATGKYVPLEIESKFAIKIEVPPLKERNEDLQFLIDIYLEEASSIYKCELNKKELDFDLSQNGISLKESIYKNTLLKSLNKEDLISALEAFLLKELKKGHDYKDLLEIFEVPLLKAAKLQFKSQLQMATNLNINRMTLRKKISQYSLDE